MSVINQMLRELESRRPREDGAAPVPEQVKAVSRARGARRGWVAALVLAAAGFAGWLVAHPPGREAASPSRPIPAVPQRHRAVVATPQRPPAVVAAPLSPPPRSPSAQLPLRLSGTLSMAPRRQDAAPPGEAPRPKTAVKPRLRAVAAIPAPASPLAPPAPATGDGAPPAAVDKHERALSPRQQAENAYRKAVTLLQQGGTAEAAEALKQALQLDPGHEAARRLLVGLLLDQKRYAEAAQRLREGLEADPGQAELAMLLARLQVGQGNLQAALKTLQRTLPYAADRPDYQAFLAALWQRAGRHKEAVQAYLQALRLISADGEVAQSGVWWMGLGISLQAENRLPEAEQAFTRAEQSGGLTPRLQSFVQQRLKELR